MSRFLESQARGAGFALPTPRDEAWRYTSLKALEQRELGVGDAEAASRAPPPELLGGDGDARTRLVFLNGAYRPDLDAGLREAGITVEVRMPDRDGSPAGADALAQLNRRLAPQEIVVGVAPGVRVGTPLHLVHVGMPGAGDFAWYARCVVQLGEGASLDLVERHLAGAAHANVGNLVLEFRLARGARLGWTRIQAEGEGATLFAQSAAILAEEASLEHVALDAGALLARHGLTVELAAPRASFRARGVFALRARQHADTQLHVVHAARDTRCDVAWRGLADGRARGVFGGAITMREGADGADARLENKNLLLSPHAEIDTKPVLEINADEVKASHGATVGQLDERALFYLRSRGLPDPEARGMLTYAFCASMFDGAEPVLREALRARLAAQLGAAGSR